MSSMGCNTPISDSYNFNSRNALPAWPMISTVAAELVGARLGEFKSAPLLTVIVLLPFLSALVVSTSAPPSLRAVNPRRDLLPFCLGGDGPSPGDRMSAVILMPNVELVGPEKRGRACLVESVQERRLWVSDDAPPKVETLETVSAASTDTTMPRSVCKASTRRLRRSTCSRAVKGP